MKRVKRFFQIAKAVLQLISKLLPLVGDIMECIKVVDTLVDKFNEEREKGQLKDVSFIDYCSALLRLISELAPLGYTFVETVETLIQYGVNFKDTLPKNA